MTMAQLDTIRGLLDDPTDDTTVTSMRIPTSLREAATMLLELRGDGESLSGLTIGALRSRLADLYLDAALDVHYAAHPQDRPGLEEVAWAYAQQQRLPVTEEAVIAAAGAVRDTGLEPTPRDVALWALASSRGEVTA